MGSNDPPDSESGQQTSLSNLSDLLDNVDGGRNSEKETDPRKSEACSDEQAAETESHRTKTDQSALSGYVSAKTIDQLGRRKKLLFLRQMEDFEDWMSTSGKNPNKNKGLANTTVDNYLRRLDQIYRFVWDATNECLLVIPQEWADEFCEALSNDEIYKENGDQYSTSAKRKYNDTLRKYYEWRAHEKDGDVWSPPIEFSDGNHRHADEFTKEERRKLRHVVLEYDSIRTYSDCEPEQRERLKRYLSQRLGKPKSEVTPEDWEQVNTSWEKPSLVWVSLDAGLRPIEVKRANTGWLRLDKGSLIIPKEEASKNRDNWEVALLDETVEILRRWNEQRKHLARYDGTDSLWLTREANPWKSGSLCHLLRTLCDAAGIDRTNRRITWYSIRHSVGKHMTDEGGIAQTKEQMRHRSLTSTIEYTHPSLSERESTLDKMG